MRGAYGYCFCQAEDGIRDYDVTGVQTCALPIETNVGAHGAGRDDQPRRLLVESMHDAGTRADRKTSCRERV